MMTLGQGCDVAETLLADRLALCDVANQAGRCSRDDGAPTLTLTASVATLRAWLAWCDPNGEWRDDEACADLTIDEAWAAIAATLS